MDILQSLENLFITNISSLDSDEIVSIIISFIETNNTT